MWNSGLRISDQQKQIVEDMANGALLRGARELCGVSGLLFDGGKAQTTICRPSQLPIVLGASEDLSVAVCATIGGDAAGTIAAIFPWKTARIIWNDKLKHAPRYPEEVRAEEARTMITLAEALFDGFFDSVGEMTRMSMMTANPLFCVDMRAVVLATVATEAGQNDQFCLAVTSDLKTKLQKLECTFLFVPCTKALSSILARMGKAEAA